RNRPPSAPASDCSRKPAQARKPERPRSRHAWLPLRQFPSAPERRSCAAGMHRVHCRAVLSILLTVLGLGLLIAAPEAGHLVLARLLGMRVETYSLGFGPRLLGFTHNGTEYRLSALPLGGYCRIAGFTPDDPAAQDPSDSGSSTNQPARRRFLGIRPR